MINEHWPECYYERGHHDCAIARIAALDKRVRELVRKLRSVSDRERAAALAARKVTK